MTIIDKMMRAFRQPNRAARAVVQHLREPRRMVRGGVLINRAGFQAARYLKEQAVRNMRFFNAPAHVRESLDKLDRDGIIVIENFLPEDEFAAVEADLARIEGEWPEDRFFSFSYGKNLISRITAASNYPDEAPALMRSLRDNEFIYELARATSRKRRTYAPAVTLQWVQKPDPTQPAGDFKGDNLIHTDRHFRFMKAFFYLRDVPEGMAPYVYVPGTHRFTKERLKYEYRIGVEAARNKGDILEQRRRLSEIAEELRKKVGGSEVPIIGKKNTLVISDNAGLHRRGALIEGTRTTAIMDFKFFESIAQPLYPVLKRWG